jgi:hypothetical protein
LIRDATFDDWAAIWPFLRRIVAPGETYCYDRGLTEDQAAACGCSSRQAGRSSLSMRSTQWLALPRCIPTKAGPAGMSPPRASWLIPSAPDEASDGPSASTSWRGRTGKAIERCSSTPWSRPTLALSHYGSRWAFRFWPPCRTPSTTPCTATSGCTSCTATSDCVLGLLRWVRIRWRR